MFHAPLPRTWITVAQVDGATVTDLLPGGTSGHHVTKSVAKGTFAAGLPERYVAAAADAAPLLEASAAAADKPLLVRLVCSLPRPPRSFLIKSL